METTTLVLALGSWCWLRAGARTRPARRCQRDQPPARPAHADSTCARAAGLAERVLREVRPGIGECHLCQPHTFEMRVDPVEAMQKYWWSIVARVRRPDAAGIITLR
jgi:hypothetical protein